MSARNGIDLSPYVVGIDHVCIYHSGCSTPTYFNADYVAGVVSKDMLPGSIGEAVLHDIVKSPDEG